MPKRDRILLIWIILFLLAGLVLFRPAYAAEPANKWRITSIKVCKTYSGALDTNLEVLGHYPVYSFFIPRPVWTVNGVVVEAQPVYTRGRLSAFILIQAAGHLRSGQRNTIKLSLPDQNTAKVFRYDDTRPPAGECYEFF